MTRTLLIVALAGAGCGGQEGASTTPLLAAQPVVITCDGHETLVTERTGVANGRGVAVVVHNTSDREISVSLEEHGGGGRGFAAPPGTSTHVEPIRPGRSSVACTDPFAEEPSESRRADIAVSAPKSAWVSDELQCGADEIVATNLDYSIDAVGERDSEAAARAHLARFEEPRDDVVRVGYLGRPDDVSYALVRAGKPIVIASAHRHRNTWLIDLVQRCAWLGP